MEGTRCGTPVHGSGTTSVLSDGKEWKRDTIGEGDMHGSKLQTEP